jgi:Na+-driven multidrug efflux pump
MNIVLVIYGSIDQVTGGYLYDGKVVERLRGIGVAVPAAMLNSRVLGRGVPGVWFGIVTANVATAGVSLIWLVKALSWLGMKEFQEYQCTDGSTLFVK